MDVGLIIFGGQILAGALLVYAAARNKYKRNDAEREALEKERGRGVALEVLSDAWKKAKGRGVVGYDRSLGFCALSECLDRLRSGEEIDPGVASTALGMLGMHLEEVDGRIIVCDD